MAATDNKLGDFTDSNTGLIDYGYDRNGNMVTDKNKLINGAVNLDVTSGGAIQYNHLNLPYRVTMKDAANLAIDKGTITYIYDAAGNKLEKRVHENASGSVAARDVSTAYMAAGAVYENKALQFMGQEEGRIRLKVDGAVTTYNYDYFIKDHLGNVRMVLSDKAGAAQVYQATIEEGSRREQEVQQFGEQVSNLAVPKPSTFDGEGTGNQRVVKLNGSEASKRTGPGVVLKVMAGDKIRAGTYSWYQGTVDNTAPDPALASSVLSQLLTGIAGAGKAGAGALLATRT